MTDHAKLREIQVEALREALRRFGYDCGVGRDLHDDELDPTVNSLLPLLARSVLAPAEEGEATELTCCRGWHRGHIISVGRCENQCFDMCPHCGGKCCEIRVAASSPGTGPRTEDPPTMETRSMCWLGGIASDPDDDGSHRYAEWALGRMSELRSQLDEHRRAAHQLVGENLRLRARLAEGAK